jgi:hypothetical protein
MSWIKQNGVKITGFAIIVSIVCSFLFIAFVLSIGLMTQYQVKVPNVELFTKIQRSFYLHGFRNMWRYQEECAAGDAQLTYKPVIGNCDFVNLEFDTTLSFDADGRKNSYPWDVGASRISVLGDSHAMGWGVNDDETFSAELQRLTGKRVYNLGVSSYATEREIERLLQLEALEDVDTIVIQYCDNDFRANLNYPIDRSMAQSRLESGRRGYLIKQE